jgi:hypothetical protein
MIHVWYVIGDTCMVCNWLHKDGGHLYFECKTVRQLKNLIGLNDMTCALVDMFSARQVIEFMLGEKKSKIRIIVLLWTWWLERNRISELIL